MAVYRPYIAQGRVLDEGFIRLYNLTIRQRRYNIAAFQRFYSIPALLLSDRKNTQDGELFSHTVRLFVFLRHKFGYRPTNVELVKSITLMNYYDGEVLQGGLCPRFVVKEPATLELQTKSN